MQYVCYKTLSQILFEGNLRRFVTFSWWFCYWQLFILKGIIFSNRFRITLSFQHWEVINLNIGIVNSKALFVLNLIWTLDQTSQPEKTLNCIYWMIIVKQQKLEETSCHHWQTKQGSLHHRYTWRYFRKPYDPGIPLYTFEGLEPSIKIDEDIITGNTSQQK